MAIPQIREKDSKGAENGLSPSSKLAIDLYDRELRAKLEPDFIGSYVAIHVDSGEYLVDKTYSRAYIEMKKALPTGHVVLLAIGGASEGLRRRVRGAKR